VRYNVCAGGPEILLKGDDHTVEHNTVIGRMQLVISFAAACGMNQRSVVRFNAANVMIPRGGCTVEETGYGLTKGQVINSLNTTTTKHNYPAAVGRQGNVCMHVRSCASLDFRPKAADTTLGKSAGSTIGAYTSNTKLYSTGGRAEPAPSFPLPHNGAAISSDEVSALIFRPARGCSTHTVHHGASKAAMAIVAELDGSANVYDIPAKLVSHGQHFWQVMPGKSCSGAAASPIWTFNVVTATATPTHVPTLPPLKPIQTGVRGSKGCNLKKELAQGPRACAALAAKLGMAHFSYCSGKDGQCYVEKYDCVKEKALKPHKLCAFYATGPAK